MPCQHEIFCCRKLGLDPQTSLYFKQRWFLKYPEKIKERLYAEVPSVGVMTRHMRHDYSVTKNVQLDKLKSSNHPDLTDYSYKKPSKITYKKFNKPKKLAAEDSILVQDSSMTPNMT